MIKLFEEYNEYYREINYDEYVKYSNNILPFNKDEIERLKKVFDNYSSIFVYRFIYTNKSIIGFDIDMCFSSKFGYIYKLPDEWYFCYLDGKNYKCDQMEGLIKLIEDLYD